MQAKRASRRIRYVASGKENACPSEVLDEGGVLNKSPLPVGYPRIPLQDITAIISPESNLLSSEAGSSRKPMKTKGRKKASYDLRQALQPVQINNEPKTKVEYELKVEVISMELVKDKDESQITQSSSDPPIPKRRKHPQGASNAKPSSSNIMKFR